MEVTKHNFHENLDSIIESIQECSFLAIDGEFTGLDTAEHGHVAPFDTPTERYNKLRKGATDFLLIQFGLCTFKVDRKKQRYEAKPYNFYIFQIPHNRHAPDRRFLCQSSSIDFLCSQGFDFNKLFNEGISYLTLDQEARLRKDLDQRHNEIQSPDGVHSIRSPASVPKEQKAFLDDVCEKINVYLKGDDKEALALSPCNAFQRKLIYQTIEAKFPLAHLETVTGEKKVRYIMVHRTKDTSERIKKELDKQVTEKMELDIQVGFTKVLQAITKSGKLVVGHNMMLDVIHSLNQFQCSLPEDLDEFKTLVKSVFPRLLDTKLMASTHPFKEHITITALEEVRLSLRQPPFSPVEIDFADGFDQYKDGGGSLHEAGFDAYITGSCFAVMTKFLGTFQTPQDIFLCPTSPVLEPFVNKLFLMRIQDIPYLNLNGQDLEPCRPHVFHVTFPSEWKSSDLHALFHPYGNIQISWLSDTTAYASLYKKDNTEIAQKGLTQDINSPYHVVPYAIHVQRQAVQWSTPNIRLVRHAEHKRKLPNVDVVFPSAMIKKQKLTIEVLQCPSIPENDSESDGDKEVVTPTTHRESEKNRMEHGSNSEAHTSEAEKKLFDESASWL